MICSLKRTKLARTPAVVLLLALLLNVNAHVFTHLNEVLTSQPTIGQSDDSRQQSDSSLFNDHDCLGCQSLQHRLVGSAAMPALMLVAVAVKIGWQAQLFPACQASHATSGRAPPFV